MHGSVNGVFFCGEDMKVKNNSCLHIMYWQTTKKKKKTFLKKIHLILSKYLGRSHILERLEKSIHWNFTILHFFELNRDYCLIMLPKIN